MPQNKPGDAVASRCTRCDDVTGHVIVALVGDQIIKVECRACGSVHRYRPPEGVKPARKESPRRVKQGTERGAAIKEVRAATASSFAKASSPSAGKTTGLRAAKAAQAVEDEWRKAIALAPGSSRRAYSMQAAFAVDDLVEHPVFGNGIVREVMAPDKMRVLFRDGARLLRCTC